MNKLFRISEVSKKVDLLDKKTNKPLNYIIRYWEREFKIIRAKKINNQRYYTLKQVKIIKMIKYLLKNKGMTISGVKDIINTNTNKLDDYDIHGLKIAYYKDSIKTKSNKIIKKINEIKIYGKKNSS